MNFLRKIGNWLWLNKERMVLAVMVAFLIFRVYQVVRPEPGGEGATKNYIRPGLELSPDANPPGMPPPPPPPPPTEDWSRIWRFSPFDQYRSGQGGGSDNRSETADINLRLLRVRELSPGDYRAQIESESRTGWYEPGQAFETYEVLEIDAGPPARVTVFSERHQRSVELTVQN